MGPAKIDTSPSSRQPFHPSEEASTMVVSRWIRAIGPGIAVLGAVGFIGSTTLGAGPGPWDPVDCGSPPRATQPAEPRDPANGLRGQPWYRLDGILDAGGTLGGQRLSLGVDGVELPRRLDLPAESFAAGPFGDVVLVGADDGSVSRLEAIDARQRCRWPTATDAAVIRRATIDPDGTTIYETRVDRQTRADAGVWARSLDGQSAPRRILGPLPADDRYGRTFSTEFAWDPEGRVLAIQSCGEIACRTRVIRPADGSTAIVDEPDLGLLIGLDADRLVTYAACHGLPCPIVSTELRTGIRRRLTRAGGLATVVGGPSGGRLVHEVTLADGPGLRVVGLDGSGEADLGPLPEGRRLVAAGPFAGSASGLPRGWVLLAPDGRLPADGATADLDLRRIPDGSTVPLSEVVQ